MKRLYCLKQHSVVDVVLFFYVVVHDNYWIPSLMMSLVQKLAVANVAADSVVLRLLSSSWSLSSFAAVTQPKNKIFKSSFFYLSIFPMYVECVCMCVCVGKVMLMLCTSTIMDSSMDSSIEDAIVIVFVFNDDFSPC